MTFEGPIAKNSDLRRGKRKLSQKRKTFKNPGFSRNFTVDCSRSVFRIQESTPFGKWTETRANWLPETSRIRSVTPVHSLTETRLTPRVSVFRILSMQSPPIGYEADLSPTRARGNPQVAVLVARLVNALS
jgi:hypothetical protein